MALGFIGVYTGVFALARVGWTTITRITTAAAEVEEEAFKPNSLDDISARDDELGRLARIFKHMAIEVFAREERLKLQVSELKIEVDRAKKAVQVAEIVDTDFFQELAAKAKEMRAKAKHLHGRAGAALE